MHPHNPPLNTPEGYPNPPVGVTYPHPTENQSAPQGWPPVQPEYPGGPWPPYAPPTRPAKQTGKWIAIGVAGVLVASGTGFATHHFLASNKDGECSVAQGLTYSKIKQKNSDDPIISVPLVDGWSQYPFEDIPVAAAKNPSVRGFVANLGAREKGFTPNIVVTVDAVRDDEVSNQELLDKEVNTLRSIATISGRQSVEVCGFPGVRVDADDVDDAMDGSAIAVVATDPRGKRWVAAATIQTRNASERSYKKQRDALMEGLTITFPDAGS